MRTIREQREEQQPDKPITLDPPPPTTQEAVAELKPLGHEAPEIVDEGAQIGAKRLDRPLMGSAVTAFIGGMSVSFGAVAMVWAAASLGGAPAPSPAHLIGALTFPIGFIILLIGKSELFTENFFLPVTAVLERRGSLQQLAGLWSITLAFNLVGGLVFAVLISRPGLLDRGAIDFLINLAEHKVHYPLGVAFIKAVFAGWLMTMLTWLLIAVQEVGPRLLIIWAIGALIVLGQFNHVIISAAEIFMAMFLGASLTLGDWLLGNFLPALVGNVIGGVVFVTALFYVQAQFAD